MKKEKKIKVLLVEPLKVPRVVTIKNELEQMQQLVEGYIEVIGIEDNVDIICNEEGKINDLLPNRALILEDGEIIDIIFGTFFIAGSDNESGEFISLSDENIRFYKEHFHHPEVLRKENGKVITQKVTQELATYLLENILHITD